MDENKTWCCCIITNSQVIIFFIKVKEYTVATKMSSFVLKYENIELYGVLKKCRLASNFLPVVYIRGGDGTSATRARQDQ